MGKRELVALLGFSSWCIVIVVWLFLAVPWVCLRFVIVVFPDHTHLLFITLLSKSKTCPYEGIMSHLRGIIKKPLNPVCYDSVTVNQNLLTFSW